MSSRLLLTLGGFVLIVGGGALWLLIQTLKRKKIKENLLSLPKERRFFWYQLKEAGFEIEAQDLSRQASLYIDGEKKRIGLQLDFLARFEGKRYACVFSPQSDEKEYLMLFYLYLQVYQTEGVIFYHAQEKKYQIWEP